MKIQNPHQRIVTALAAVAIGLAAVSIAQAGAVGGPEYGIVQISDRPSVEPQKVTQAYAQAASHLDVTNLPCTPSCPKDLAAGASSEPNQQLVLKEDAFDWEDAGIGAGVGIALMFAGVVGALEARKHRILAR